MFKIYNKLYDIAKNTKFMRGNERKQTFIINIKLISKLNITFNSLLMWTITL